jgi:hypothetical protein
MVYYGLTVQNRLLNIKLWWCHLKEHSLVFNRLKLITLTHHLIQAQWYYPYGRLAGPSLENQLLMSW